MIRITFVALLALAACEPHRPARASSAIAHAGNSPAIDEPRHIDRQAAIDGARRDAALRFGAPDTLAADARRAGRFWIVELQGANGGRLRYTISTTDGSIRERSASQ